MVRIGDLSMQPPAPAKSNSCERGSETIFGPETIRRSALYLVHLRATTGDAVEFVLARDFDHAVLVRERGVDVGVQNDLFCCTGFREGVSFAVDDLRMSGEGEAALLADAVGRRNKDVILGGTNFW